MYIQKWITEICYAWTDVAKKTQWPRWTSRLRENRLLVLRKRARLALCCVDMVGMQWTSDRNISVFVLWLSSRGTNHAPTTSSDSTPSLVSFGFSPRPFVLAQHIRCSDPSFAFRVAASGGAFGRWLRWRRQGGGRRTWCGRSRTWCGGMRIPCSRTGEGLCNVGALRGMDAWCWFGGFD